MGGGAGILSGAVSGCVLVCEDRVLGIEGSRDFALMPVPPLAFLLLIFLVTSD